MVMKFLTKLETGALALVVFLNGCAQKEESKRRAAPPTGTPAPAQGNLRKFISRQGVHNEIRQLGLFYQQYNLNYGRPPANLEALESYMGQDDPKLIKAIKEGYYTVVWNIRNLSSNVVLAYETEQDDNGLRFVVMGDASVTKMSERDFQTALRSK
jgi:hypothetical protein